MARKKKAGSTLPVGQDRTDDLRRRSIAALSNASIVVLADRAVQLVGLAITARLLLPPEIAVVAAGGTAISLFGLLTTMGVPSFLIQVATPSPAIHAAARTTLSVSVGIGIALVEIFAPAIARWFNNPDVADALRVMALILVAPILSAPALARLSRDLRARDVALADLIGNALGICCVTLPLAMTGHGFWSLAWGAVAQVLLRSTIQCVLARQPLLFGLDLSAVANVSRRSVGFMLNTLLIRLEVEMPHWIVGRYLPATDLGLFSRANSLMNYPSGLFYSIVDRVIFPAVALVQNEARRLREGALDAVRLTAIIGVPITVALFFLGGDIIILVLGPHWAGAIGPFKILALAAYFKLAMRLNWIVLRALGETYRLAAVQAVLLVVTIAACITGARWGLCGVAVVVAAMIFASYAASGVLAMRAAKISFASWIFAHGHGLACGMLAAAVLGPLVTFLGTLDTPPIIVLAAAGLVGLASSGIAARLAPGVFLGRAGAAVLHSALAMLQRQVRRTSP